MREIKFRAWDKEKKEMLWLDGKPTAEFAFWANGDVVVVPWNSRTYQEIRRGRMVIMQSIGRTDANGVEIYEGDILDTGFFGLIGRVVYCPRTARFVVADRKGNFTSGRWDECKVIGNIFETPELLEGGGEK